MRVRKIEWSRLGRKVANRIIHGKVGDYGLFTIRRYWRQKTYELTFDLNDKDVRLYSIKECKKRAKRWLEVFSRSLIT